MTIPLTIGAMELCAVEEIFEMGSGCVLDFGNRTLAGFFTALAIDIEHEFPEGSKAKRLGAFLRGADKTHVVQTLEALLEHRGVHEGDDCSDNLVKVKNLIARLGGPQVPMLPVTRSVDVLKFAYVHEFDTKIDQRLTAVDLEGSIMIARTMLQTVLVELESKLTGARGDYQGNLPKQFKAVAKLLRIDHKRAALDDNFKQVARGLIQIVNGLAPVRNRMSDGHARERKPQVHHARVIVQRREDCRDVSRGVVSRATRAGADRQGARFSQQAHENFGRCRMSRKKKPSPSLVRSSTAEYLTFVAASGASEACGEGIVRGAP